MLGTRLHSSSTLAHTGLRAAAILLLVLQALAPWLHAHTAAARTVGFHLHLVTVPHEATTHLSATGRSTSAQATAQVFRAADEPGIGMPGGWLRQAGEIHAFDSPPPPSGGLVLQVMPVAASRVRGLDAARPPPPLALVAYASQAPPTTRSMRSRG